MLTPARNKTLFKVLTKDQIRKSALTELRFRGVNCWIQNNLAVRGRKFIGRYGVSDILGFVERTNHYELMGTFVVCEVKTIGDVFSDDQKKFLTEVKQAGGIALYATQELNQVVIKQWEG
jgi:hypothetical protein